jgi:hypothetical protein
VARRKLAAAEALVEVAGGGHGAGGELGELFAGEQEEVALEVGDEGVLADLAVAEEGLGAGLWADRDEIEGGCGGGHQAPPRWTVRPRA